MNLPTQGAAILILALLNASIAFCEPFEIFIKTLDGATFGIEVEPANTVARLKEKIQEKTGAPVRLQILTFEEDEVDDERPMARTGLKSGSIVLMVFYVWDIKNVDQLNHALNTKVLYKTDPYNAPKVSNKANPYNAPIFHEAPREGDDALISHSKIYKDSRNWIFCLECDWTIRKLFDPTARLELGLIEDERFVRFEFLLRHYGPNSRNVEMSEYLILRTRRRMVAIISQIRNNTWHYEHHGIRLGATSPQGERLEANINNYAPDAFADLEIVRLFDVSEMVRKQLESDASTGDYKLGLAREKEINRGVLHRYASALAGYEPAADIAQPGGDETCSICMDNLSAEPACELACHHSFHTDCLHQWAQNLNREGRSPNCPYCRKPYSESYADVMYDSLEYLKNLKQN